MAESENNVIPIKSSRRRRGPHGGDPKSALAAANGDFAALRAELVCAAAVLSNSAWTEGDITSDVACSAVIVLEKAVERLSELQSAFDGIASMLALNGASPDEDTVRARAAGRATTECSQIDDLTGENSADEG